MATGNGRRPAQRQSGNGQRQAQPAEQQRGDLVDRQPPFDLMAEKCLLGSMVLMPEVCDEVAPLLRDEDFYDQAHQVFYRHVVAMHESNRRFDVVLLTDRIKAAGEYEKVGGAKYIGEIVNAVPNAAHAVHYAEIVRDKALLRRIILESTDTLREAYDGQADGREIVARAESAIARVSDGMLVGQETRSLSRIVVESMEALDERMARGTSRILDVGLEAFRDCMGLVPGGVTIIAGRASMGKTALALSIAANVATRVGRVHVTSLEMTALELADRLLCMRSLVPFHSMASGRITPEQRMRLVESSGAVSRMPIVIDDRPGQNLAQVAASIRREQRRGGLSLAIIDYAQLIEPDDHRVDRVEQLSKISRSIKRLARQSNIPVISLVQVNRQSEGNADLRPRLHQLKGTGSWEEDADSVAFVFRPHFNAETGQVAQQLAPGQGEDAEITLAKNRNGPRRCYQALWFKDSMTWQNRAGPQFEQDYQEQDRSF